MNPSMHIMFAGGGTGGHLFPGLAVADALALQLPGCQITFCGTGKDWERKEVTEAGFEYKGFAAAPLVASPMGMLRAIYSNSIGYRAARCIIQAERPGAIIGLGGYSSVPLGLGAARLGVPLILLEQNLIPGRANRVLARWASAVCVGFPETEEHFSVRPRVVSTGNPVRASIIAQSAAREEQANLVRDAQPLLLILGGSQGAHSLNQHVVESLPRLASNLIPWQIIHQTGSRDVEWVRAAYAETNLRVEVTPFIHDMADVYRRTTLVITRAGATTLAELAVAGIPAILFPYPLAAANHQWYNAQAYGRAGAAVVVDDRPNPGRSAAALLSAVLPLIKLPELRREMRRAMLQIAQPAAAKVVVSQILMVVATAQHASQPA